MESQRTDYSDSTKRGGLSLQSLAKGPSCKRHGVLQRTPESESSVSMSSYLKQGPEEMGGISRE